jgi:ribosomal protein S18 acetylase RimI-like enzyme
MADIQIREAVVDDAAGIARVHVITWQHAYRGQIPAPVLDGLSIAGRTQMWAGQLGNLPARTHTLVALDGDQVVGFCSVGASREPDAGDQSGFLYAIYIDPAYMGKGIGSTLITEGVSKLQSDGFTHATLWVLATNAPTIRFYERHGWSADGVTKFERMGDFELQELRYARRLDQA